MHILLTIILLFIIGCAPNHYKLLYKQKPAFYSYVISSQEKKIDYNPDVYITPASCQKTITAILANKTLTYDYQYKTDLYQRGNDIIIKFSGDPVFTSENMIQLLEPLKNKKIKGKIIFDNSLYKTSHHSHNIMVDDIGTYYAPPISAIILDGNIVNIKVKASKDGELADISNDTGYKIESIITTNKQPTNIKLSWENGKIKAIGNININETKEIKLSPPELNPYILLKSENILNYLNIRGTITIKKELFEYSNAKLINSVKTAPLKEYLGKALYTSDNLIFDSIYLKIIHNYSNDIKEWEDGYSIIKSLIQAYLGVDLEEALLVDGSGLSRYNRIKTKSLHSILDKAFSIKEFVNAMPQKELSNGRTIKVKTGSMSGIACLAGYHSEPAGSFVIISNSFSPPLSEIFDIEYNFLAQKFLY